MSILYSFILCFLSISLFSQGTFPDGKPISKWFSDKLVREIKELGKSYNLLDYGVVKDIALLQTKAIQAVLDRAAKPMGAPSNDAINLDVCQNVLVSDGYMSVNDDAISLKGGKGPWADKDFNNGSNKDIIIEKCTFGYCHAALTCGSESIHNRNIILRNCKVDRADRLLHLKMRLDTPQLYENILIESIKGSARSFLFAKLWTQFFDLKNRKDMPMSYAKHIVMRNIRFTCNSFLEIEKTDQFSLTDFTFQHIDVNCKRGVFDKRAMSVKQWKDVRINGDLG